MRRISGALSGSAGCCSAADASASGNRNWNSIAATDSRASRDNFAVMEPCDIAHEREAETEAGSGLTASVPGQKAYEGLRVICPRHHHV